MDVRKHGIVVLARKRLCFRADIWGECPIARWSVSEIELMHCVRGIYAVHCVLKRYNGG